MTRQETGQHRRIQVHILIRQIGRLRVQASVMAVLDIFSDSKDEGVQLAVLVPEKTGHKLSNATVLQDENMSQQVPAQKKRKREDFLEGEMYEDCGSSSDEDEEEADSGDEYNPGVGLMELCQGTGALGKLIDLCPCTNFS